MTTSSRRLSDLSTEMQRKEREFEALAKERNLSVLIYCTYRDPIEQARLYRQGRSIHDIRRKSVELQDLGRPDLAELLMRVGPQYDPDIVTYAGPGQSAHNYREAWDGVPMLGGKPQWSVKSKLWKEYGNCARESGLEWAGDWTSFTEYPHVQRPGFHWRKAIGYQRWDEVDQFLRGVAA